MAFPEFYAEIRSVHIAAALASGTLFFLRGAVLFSGRQWALAAPVRYLAMGIDTVLLGAAVALTTIVRQYPLADAWLTAKVALLVLYIGLGLVAFWKGRSRGVRVCAWAAALVVFAAIYSVARAHHPLGLLR